jgi:N-acetyl-gamma-glutamyl-phosphate reductase
VVKVGIYGDTGMVGKELDRTLVHHDRAEVVFRQNSRRSEGDIADCDVAFLATRDPESMAFAPEALDAGARVIDMAGAFRLPREDFEAWYKLKHETPDLLQDAVYGMPALYANEIAKARLVANPGCYPTSVILPLRPLKNLVEGPAVIVATSGNSGARSEVEETSNELTYSYGRRHKHVPEMERYSGFDVSFTPIVLRSVFAGINTNIRVALNEELRAADVAETEARLRDTISSAYRDEDLVRVVVDDADTQWGTREAVGTHKLLVKLNVDEGYAYICSVIDNLGKGAASQAVENMNLMTGLPRLHGIDGAYSTT